MGYLGSDRLPLITQGQSEDAFVNLRTRGDSRAWSQVQHKATQRVLLGVLSLFLF